MDLGVARSSRAGGTILLRLFSGLDISVLSREACVSSGVTQGHKFSRCTCPLFRRFASYTCTTIQVLLYERSYTRVRRDGSGPQGSRDEETSLLKVVGVLPKTPLVR